MTSTCILGQGWQNLGRNHLNVWSAIDFVFIGKKYEKWKFIVKLLRKQKKMH